MTPLGHVEPNRWAVFCGPDSFAAVLSGRKMVPMGVDAARLGRAVRADELQFGGLNVFAATMRAALESELGAGLWPTKGDA